MAAKSFAVLAVMALAQLPPAMRPRPGPFSLIPNGPDSIIRSMLTGEELAIAQSVSKPWHKEYKLWSPQGRKMYEAKTTKRIQEDQALYADSVTGLLSTHCNLFCCRYLACVAYNPSAILMVPSPCDRCRFHFSYYMEPVPDSQDPWLATLDNDSFYAGPQLCDPCQAESDYLAAEKAKAEARIKELRERARELVKQEKKA